MISVLAGSAINYKSASLNVLDSNAKLITQIPLKLKPGLNEVLFKHTYGLRGEYTYTIIADNVEITRKKVVF